MKAARPGQPLAETRLPSTWASVGGDVDIDAADGGDFWLAILQRRDSPAGQTPLTAISTCAPWQIVKIGLPAS